MQFRLCLHSKIIDTLVLVTSDISQRMRKSLACPTEFQLIGESIRAVKSYPVVTLDYYLQRRRYDFL